MNIQTIALGSVPLILVLVGCLDQDSNKPMENRWYSEAQVASGKILFQANCGSCHQPDASGSKEWKSTDANGNYPPPPLNGSAHTWHHPMSVLRRTITNGGAALGGVMPDFKHVLKAEEVDAVIAFFQSTWSQEIYMAWDKRNE